MHSSASDFVKRQVIRLLPRRKREKTLGILLGRLVRGALIGVGVLVGMTVALPTFQPSELLQLLGVGGIAIGFAFRDIFENFLAGILILLDQPFQIGDQIITGEYEGTVREIQIRATYIRTYDGRQVVIPNSNIFKSSVMVNTAYDSRRSEYDVGIGYEDDIERAQEIMLDVMRNTDGVLSSPAPDTVMTEMGDSAIVLRVRWWTKPDKATVLRTQNKVLRRIKNTITE
ncbi:MAG: mechanosensitive ion channel family protein, partial [Chloroflexota bacterium]